MILTKAIKKSLFVSFILISFAGCKQNDPNIPVVRVCDAFQDNTIEQAKNGFNDALAEKMVSMKKMAP